jgi:hypothetical protein
VSAFREPFGDGALPDDAHDYLTQQLRGVLQDGFDRLGGEDPRDLYLQLCNALRRLGDVEWLTPHGRTLRARKQTSLEAQYQGELKTDQQVMTEALGHIAAGEPLLGEVVLGQRLRELGDLPALR